MALVWLFPVVRRPIKKFTVAVDFDGVLHSYISPWVAPHVIPDPPVEGAMEWLFKTIQKFEVVIFSTRCRTWRGRRAMRRWLLLHAGAICYYSYHLDNMARGLEDIRFSYTKPVALVYLDDRAMRFTGTFPTVDEIHKARPWNFERRW